MEDSDIEIERNQEATDQLNDDFQRAMNFGNQNEGSDENNQMQEKLEIEIPNDQEITNDYVTVMAVSNFLNKAEN